MPGPRHSLDEPDDGRALHIGLTVCTLGLWAVTGWPVAVWRRRRRQQQQAPGTERVAVL